MWLRNGREYEHILPLGQYKLNILPSLRDAFWRWFGTQDIQLHRDFHHLNSSQALCFNLFFPLIRENGRGLATLLSIIKVEGQLGSQAVFEFQPDPREGTRIDFSLPLKGGARINFEIKYTESEFGTAKTDNKHLEKFEKLYTAQTASRFEPSFCTASQFLKHYQIMRNIWHLRDDTDDIAVFLFPKSNALLRQHESVIRNCALRLFGPTFSFCIWKTL